MIPSSSASMLELDIDALEKEMFNIMACNNELEETLNQKKVTPRSEATEPAKRMQDTPELSDRKVDQPNAQEDWLKLRASLEERLEASESRCSRIKEEYVGKFKKAEQDYTEKFRQVKEVCLQLANQINASEDAAAKAQSSEAKVREDCEDLRKRLAETERKLADAAAAATGATAGATADAEALRTKLADAERRLADASAAAAVATADAEALRKKLADTERKLADVAAAAAGATADTEAAALQQLTELQRRADREVQECAKWQRMALEEQEKNNKLRQELAQAHVAASEALKAERQARRCDSGVLRCDSGARTPVASSDDLDSATKIQRLQAQLENARQTSRESLQAAEEWKRGYDRLGVEVEQLRAELARVTVPKVYTHYDTVCLRKGPREG